MTLVNDVAFETTTLKVVDVNRYGKEDGQIKCDNGQWYSFIGFNNDWNDNGLDLPIVGLYIRIQFDAYSNPIDWRSV